MRPGRVSQEHPVPDDIEKPSYYYRNEHMMSTQGEGEVKRLVQINGVRRSSELAAYILQKCSEIVDVGVTTEEIDKFVHFEAINLGAYPSPLRYAGFPKSVCTSVNNVICHGIPDDRPLADGDIINVDVTVRIRKIVFSDAI